MAGPTSDYLPGVERHSARDAGIMLPGANWMLLLHTMETNSFSGGVNTLDAKQAWPHLCLDLDDREGFRFIQGPAFTRAARALKSGGNLGKTNAARVIQIEIKGFAHETPFWSPEKNALLGQAIAAVAKVVPFQLAFPLPFYGDTSGFTVASPTAKQRMSYLQWYLFNAICGHEHAPKPNAHWDPGQINTIEIAAGWQTRPSGIATPPVPYNPPRFNAAVGTLRPGPHPSDPARAAANRTMKVMLKIADFGDSLDLSTPAKAETWGPGTSHEVEEIAKLYYKNKGRPFPKNYKPSMGPEMWNWLRQLMILKHAIDQQAKAK